MSPTLLVRHFDAASAIFSGVMRFDKVATLQYYTGNKIATSRVTVRVELYHGQGPPEDRVKRRVLGDNRAYITYIGAYFNKGT